MHLNQEVNTKVDNGYRAYTVAFPQMSPRKQHKRNKQKKKNDGDLFFMRESFS
jgi:hypothetical protein